MSYERKIGPGGPVMLLKQDPERRPRDGSDTLVMARLWALLTGKGRAPTTSVPFSTPLEHRPMSALSIIDGGKIAHGQFEDRLRMSNRSSLTAAPRLFGA